MNSSVHKILGPSNTMKAILAGCWLSMFAWCGYQSASARQTDFPNVFGPKKPVLETSLADAKTEITFLDDYNPSVFIPMQEMPPSQPGIFLLAPGHSYDLWAQSFCLQSGKHGSAGGDGYLYAQATGKGSSIIQAVLLNASAHPDISQNDIQVLLWAIIAETSYNQMDEKIQRTAQQLLTTAELKKLQTGVVPGLASGLFVRLKQELPPDVQRLMEVQANLRNMFSKSLPTYSEIEGLAIMPGEAPAMSGDRDVPVGRWSFDPKGFFISFFPQHYQSTLIQVRMPGETGIRIDKLGRITRIEDIAGNLIQAEYADTTGLEVAGDKAVRAYLFRSLHFRKMSGKASKSEKIWDISSPGSGYALVGLPSGTAAGGNTEMLPDLTERYGWTQQQKKENESLRKSLGAAKGTFSRTTTGRKFALLSNVGSFAKGVQMTLNKDGAHTGNQADSSLANPAYEAWESLFASFLGDEPEQNPRPITSISGTSRDNEDWEPGEVRPWPKKKASQLQPYDPSESVAQPARDGAQRLGQSGRGQEVGESKPNGRRNGGPNLENPAEDSWKNKAILVRAKNAMSVIQSTPDIVKVITSPTKIGDIAMKKLPGKVRKGLGLDMQAQTKDWMFNLDFTLAGKISVALAGDPPRSDYNLVATPQQADLNVFLDELGPVTTEDREMNILVELCSILNAAQLTRDRLGGAVQAGNQDAIQRQGKVLLNLKQQAGAAWLKVADLIDQRTMILMKGGDIITYSQADLKTWREQLRNEGYPAAAKDAARRLNLSESELEALRNEALGFELPDSFDLITAIKDLADSVRDLGLMWTSLPAARVEI